MVCDLCASLSSSYSCHELSSVNHHCLGSDWGVCSWLMHPLDHIVLLHAHVVVLCRFLFNTYPGYSSQYEYEGCFRVSSSDTIR